MKEIVFAGFGGQGVLTSGLIISHIAVDKGMNATWIPSYGSAMRGGTANCTVKFGKETIFNPSQEEPDILLAMNTPSFNKFYEIIKPGGIAIINSDTVSTEANDRDDITIIKLPCNSLANEIKHNKGANIIMTGAIIKLLGDFTDQEAIDGMINMFEEKGKSKYHEINKKAMNIGLEYK